MKDRTCSRHLLSVIFGIFLILTFPGYGEADDFSDWNVLVKKYVSPKAVDGISINAVDYVSLKNDPAFSSLVSRLKSYPMGRLESDKSRLAFWINVYNILAVKMITDHYPVESIKDIGSFFSPVWKRKAGVVGGKERTLHDIEHEILRKMNEPRIHVAIVCASVSCPDLRMEAYTAEKLSDQLDDQMRKFLLSREKGMKLDEKGKKVYLSSIFKWFEDDFESHGGVLKFISKYILGEERQLLASRKIKVFYLDYNWKVNGR